VSPVTALPRGQVIVGDARENLRRLPTASVDCVCTSPPYFRLRDYGATGQLGLEAHVDDWVEELRAVLAEVARVLLPTGSCWLNLGDSYATHRREGAARKSLLLGPERLALALLKDGWRIRNTVIWAKTNPLPSPAVDRLAATHERLLLLVRGDHYFFDLDAIRQPHRSQPSHRQVTGIATTTAIPLAESWRGPNSNDVGGLQHLKAAGRVGHPLGKNPGDVWALPAGGYRGAHHATFPLSLARRVIQAGCPEARCQGCRRPWRRATLRNLDGTASRGLLTPTCDCNAMSEPGLALDPFFGAGTTALAAEQLQRDWLGIELNPDFASIARERLQLARARGPTGPTAARAA
jgi:site-specific DNA-methyltransferase (adenine-specific)